MLTGIIRATRAHYAALQLRAAPDRIPLYYSVAIRPRLNSADEWVILTRGCIHVRALTESRRRAELTKLTRRLTAMFPEATDIDCSYQRGIA